jgi:hypothetical protein
MYSFFYIYTLLIYYIIFMCIYVVLIYCFFLKSGTGTPPPHVARVCGGPQPPLLFIRYLLAPTKVCCWRHKHVYYHYHYCYYCPYYYMNGATLHQQAASIRKYSNTTTCHTICHVFTADWLMEFLEASIWQVAYTWHTRGRIVSWSDGPR